MQHVVFYKLDSQLDSVESYRFGKASYSGYRYTPYSTRMSPENTHKHMGLYMEVLILDVTHVFCFVKLFSMGRIRLTLNWQHPYKFFWAYGMHKGIFHTWW